MENPTLRTLNDSGFPLQVAIHRHIDATTPEHGWKVRYSEHAWASTGESRSGFLDLVLEKEDRSEFMALECKRPRDSEWVFLHSDGKAIKRVHAQAWISRYSGGSMPTFGWRQVSVDPMCPEMQFCALRGQSAGERITLIEKTAAELIVATECLALEHKDFRPKNFDDIKLYFSVIVTTAKLIVATFEPGAISLKDGTLSEAHFEHVPYLRFRKQLGVLNPVLTPEHYTQNNDVGYMKESTVFIVNAERVAEFLQSFEVRTNSLRGY